MSHSDPKVRAMIRAQRALERAMVELKTAGLTVLHVEAGMLRNQVKGIVRERGEDAS